jgi:hypothetical protein
MVFKKQAPPKQGVKTQIYNKTLAISYGNVESVDARGLCDVKLTNGFIANRLRIKANMFSNSPSDTGSIIGGITYPAQGTEVAILHPVDDVNSGLVIPAGVDFRNKNVLDTILSGGDTSYLPGGWEYTYNQGTGKVTFTNGVLIIESDPENSITKIKNYDETTIEMGNNKVLINDHFEVLK